MVKEFVSVVRSLEATAGDAKITVWASNDEIINGLLEFHLPPDGIHPTPKLVRLWFTGDTLFPYLSVFRDVETVVSDMLETLGKYELA
jgi:hypothetical protein